MSDVHRRLLTAGDLLSNCAFNLGQTAGLPLSKRAVQSLDECRKEWDAARDALRQLQAEETATVVTHEGQRIDLTAPWKVPGASR